MIFTIKKKKKKKKNCFLKLKLFFIIIQKLFLCIFVFLNFFTVFIFQYSNILLI